MLTTTEAADFLGVSRPYLTRLLKGGTLPYRKKGNRHLVPMTALRQFKTGRDRQLDRLVELAAAEEDLGLRPDHDRTSEPLLDHRPRRPPRRHGHRAAAPCQQPSHRRDDQGCPS